MYVSRLHSTIKGRIGVITNLGLQLKTAALLLISPFSTQIWKCVMWEPHFVNVPKQNAPSFFLCGGRTYMMWWHQLTHFCNYSDIFLGGSSVWDSCFPSTFWAYRIVCILSHQSTQLPSPPFFCIMPTNGRARFPSKMARQFILT